MFPRKVATAMLACLLVASGTLIAGSTANATQNASASTKKGICETATRGTFRPKTFSKRCVKTKVPTKIVFTSDGSKFIVIATEYQITKMRGNAKGVQAYMNSRWVTVPYTIGRASRTAYLDYKKVNKNNVAKDPLSGRPVQKQATTPSVPVTPPPEAVPEPAPESAPDVDIRLWMTENGRNQAPDGSAINMIGAGWREEMLAQINTARNTAGVPSLTTCTAVNSAGQWKANDMAMSTGMTHDSTMGAGAPYYYYGNLGYKFSGAGENIAFGQQSVTEVVNAWLNSPTHRANILQASYTHLGTGAQTGQGRIFWSQEFFTAQSPCVG